MGAFEEKRLRPYQYVQTLEKLNSLATRLDKLVTELQSEAAKYPSLQPSILENTFDMQETLKSFLKTANFALDLWTHREGYQLSTQRLNRPLTRQFTISSLSGSTLAPSAIIQTGLSETIIFEPPLKVNKALNVALLVRKIILPPYSQLKV
jgi:hypothetical protein